MTQMDTNEFLEIVGVCLDLNKPIVVDGVEYNTRKAEDQMSLKIIDGEAVIERSLKYVIKAVEK